MNTQVDFYDGAYANYELDVYRQIRIETYGEDLGQTSWVTPEESGAIAKHLELNSESSVLEIGCGSGKYALHLAQQTGCRMIGIDASHVFLDSLRLDSRSLNNRGLFN